MKVNYHHRGIFRATRSPCCNNLCIVQQKRVQGMRHTQGAAVILSVLLGSSSQREWEERGCGCLPRAPSAAPQHSPAQGALGGHSHCRWTQSAELLLLFAWRVGFLTPGPRLSCHSKPGNWEMPPSFCLLSLNCWDCILMEKHRWPLQNMLRTKS